jgi:nitric oxide dioxygenase
MLKIPAVKEMFNPTHQIQLPGEPYAYQPMSLATAVHAYAANIDNLGVLGEAVERIAQKHVALYVLPEQYDVVKENLFWALGQVLGSAVTPAVAAAWSEAYDFLAWVLIEREREIREEKARAPGGWEGYREFVVDRKIEEATGITSFIIKPKDGKAILSYEPGSYIGIQVETPQGRTVRNYTLSSVPNHGEYRITVKKTPASQPGAPVGSVSTYLHEQVHVGSTVRVGVPCGDFVMRGGHSKPIVLISGGVGMTPSASMFGWLMEQNVKNEVVMISTARSQDVTLFGRELEAAAEGHSNAKIHSILDSGRVPTQEELMRTIEARIPSKDAHFYFCGPPAFMRSVLSGLKSWNVPDEQLHYEFFGPTTSL